MNKKLFDPFQNNNKIPNKDTLVTMIYDLAGIEQNMNRMLITDYIKRVDVLCKLDMNIIFYVENEYIKNEVYELRYKYDRLPKTKIIIVPYNNLKYYNILDEINKMDIVNKIVNMNPIKDTNNYRIIGWNKFEFLKKAIQLNPFDAVHFGWIDAGISHSATIPEDFEKVVSSMSNKIRIGIFNKLYVFGVERPNFYNTQKRMISAGFFTGNKENLLKLIDLFEKELGVVLKSQIAPLEDQILTKIIYYNNDLFQCFWSCKHQDLFVRWLQ